MRPVLYIAAFLSLSGCAVDCGSPSQIDGVYDVFLNFISVDSVDLDAYPAENSPVNGSHTWNLDWGSSLDGEVALVMDDQNIEATGVWNSEECGRFSLSLAGTVTDVDSNTHTFTLDGDYIDVGSQFTGEWTYVSSWANSDGVSGDVGGVGQLVATRQTSVQN